MLNTLESLFKLARERKNNPVEGSYTNKLLSDKSLSKEKVLEEINELVESVEKNTNKMQTSPARESLGGHPHMDVTMCTSELASGRRPAGGRQIFFIFSSQRPGGLPPARGGPPPPW